MKKIIIIISCLVLVIFITVLGNNYYYVKQLNTESKGIYSTTTIINSDRDSAKSNICIFISGIGDNNAVEPKLRSVVVFSVNNRGNVKIVQKEKWNSTKAQDFITEIYNLDKHNVNSDNYIKVRVKGLEYYINKSDLNKVVYDYFKINL